MEMVHWTEKFNNRIADSAVGRWFCLEGSGVPNERKGSRFFTEIRAGITTFSAMVYIIRSVLPSSYVSQISQATDPSITVSMPLSSLRLVEHASAMVARPIRSASVCLVPGYLQHRLT